MNFKIKTKGHYDFIDITDKIKRVVKESGVESGLALIFVRGSTAALTTMEFEQGLIEDIKNILEQLAPERGDYRHHLRWGDKNGAAHIKSALIGQSVAVPIEQGRLVLGAWQQITLIDFDEREREREIFVKILKGENL